MNNYKKLIRNFIVFVSLIAITFFIVFKDQNINDMRIIFQNLDLRFIFIGLLMMIGYYSLEAINIKGVLSSLGRKTKFINALRYTLIGFFFSGITPAASGGQPMEIYFMHKDGVKVEESTIALLVEIISFQIVTISCCITAAILRPSLLSNGMIYLFVAGVSLNLIALSTMLVGFLSEKLAHKIVNLFMEILTFFKYKKVEEKRAQIEATIKSYAASAKIIKKDKKILIRSFGLVLLQVLLYYTVPYWVYRAFGFNALSIYDVMIMQALLFCSVSAIPLPGSVGISESAFFRIYERIFGSRYLASATLVNRIVNFYLFIIVGLTCTIVSAIKKGKRKAEEKK